MCRDWGSLGAVDASGASASAILRGILRCIGVKVVTGCCGVRERRSGWSGRIQDGGASGYKSHPR
jgi:hypothetical protein